jgi:transposase InsO family protein
MGEAGGVRMDGDGELIDLIRRIQERHHYRYGSPRVRETLRRDCGKRTSLKKAARLTREHGLNAQGRRKFIPATGSNRRLPACENILSREFQAGRGGEKRVSSYQRYAITYPRTRGGWVYLTVVLDLYDRKVIGWAFSADMETVHTAIPAMETAFANRKDREGLLFHSDRRAQYCAKAFRGRPVGKSLNSVYPTG